MLVYMICYKSLEGYVMSCHTHTYHGLKYPYRYEYLPTILIIFCINITNIGNINQYYAVNVLSSISKPNMILPIFIKINQYLKL